MLFNSSSDEDLKLRVHVPEMFGAFYWLFMKDSIKQRLWFSVCYAVGNISVPEFSLYTGYLQ